MSYPPPDQQGGPYPPRESREPSEYPAREARESEYPPPPASEYPPPPGEEDTRARAYHGHTRAPSTGVTLPSMTMPAYDPQYGPPNGYPPPPNHDPRYQYPPPPGYPGDGRGGYPPNYGGGGAPQNMQFQQSAPRQRTAIACRYCRRRKIRCSGFEQNPNGQCLNCQRFNQECIFTPVSSQTQAFVPAHAVYPQMRNMGVGPDGRPTMMYPQGQQLYGAHGQPLGTVQPGPPQARGSPYGEYPPQSQGPPHQHAYPPHPQPQPSPTGSFHSFKEDGGETSRKRPSEGPHPAVLPPPMPGQPGQLASRDEAVTRRAPATSEETRLPPVTPTPAVPQSTYSPGSNASPAPPAPRVPAERGPAEAAAAESRTPPPRASPGERSDPMSLGNIMDKGPGGPDKDMLGRLGRNPKQPPPSS